MKILMILNATFPKPLDIRVIKEANALQEANAEVTLLCLRDKDEPTDDVYQNIKIKRIKAGASQYALAFWDIVMSLTFKHHFFYSAILRLVKEEKIDAIHVHDLPLAGTALSVKEKTGVKVVVDLHENYPQALNIWFAWKTNPIARLKNSLFLKPEKWERYEGIATQKADAVLTVVDEMKSRVIREHKIEPEKVTVISNTESRSFASQEITPGIYGPLQGKFIVAYTGGIGPHRGVDTVIEAMAFLKNYPQIVFAVIGTGSADVMKNLAARIKSLGLENTVFLLGHKPFNQVFSYMSQADVNIVPHKSNAQNENGIPHKFFQSMMASKPVLASSCGPLTRILNDTDGGVTFRVEDPKDCADKILLLYNDSALRDRLGKNGHQAATGKYSWEETGKTLADVYKKLVGSL